MVDYAAKKMDELVKIAMEKLGLSKTKARALKKDGLVARLTEAELASLPATEAPLQMLASEQVVEQEVIPMTPKTEEVIAEVAGALGQQFTVRRDPNGIVWCDCSTWVHSRRTPRTCSHMSMLVDDGILPNNYWMDEDEIAAEGALAETLRNQPTPTTLRRVRSSTPRVSSNLMPVFAVLRKMKICCAQALVDLQTNVEFARNRNYRALVCTLKGKDHVNRIYMVPIAEDYGNVQLAIDVGTQLDAAGIRYVPGEGGWLELIA